jgi:hypothetical protein
MSPWSRASSEANGSELRLACGRRPGPPALRLASAAAGWEPSWLALHRQARAVSCQSPAQRGAEQSTTQRRPRENLTTTRTNQTVARAAKSLKYAITRKLSTNRLLRTSAQKIVDLACSNVDLAYSKRVENETLASRNSQHARLTSIGQADTIACLKLENRPDISAKDLERTNLEAGISWHHLPLN